MNPSEPILFRIARWLTFGSAVAALVSIAASQILLALAVAALLISGAPLRLPRIWLPLAVFLSLTILSWIFSGDMVAGRPQIRKFFVFLELLIAYSTLRDLTLLRRLFLCWAGVGVISALRGFVQFGTKVQQAHAVGRNFYEYYVAERITGFMSHWMTFSGQEMFAFIMLVAFILFAPGARRYRWLCIAGAALIGAVLVLGWTRSIWLASGIAVLYLSWFWRRWLVVVLPI